MKKDDAKKRILEASLFTFSEKGFEGARMDGIAKEAGVNKALIYYYFKNKKDLLDTLMAQFLEDSRNLFLELLREFDFRQADQFDQLFSRVFIYLEQNEQIIRLIMLETLKKSTKTDYLYDFILIFLGEDSQTFRSIASQAGLKLEGEIDIDLVRISEFFTMIGPVLLYILLREDWVRYFQINKDELTAKFVEALKGTHISHHHGLV